MPEDALTSPDIPPPPGTTSIPDIAYGTHDRQKLDLYLPASKTRGVVAYIHGGSWLRLDRKVVRAWPLLESGYAVASLGYRLSQHATFPAQIVDINSGLARLAQIAPEYGLGMQRLALMGLSAGGHLAALAALATDVPAFKSPPGLKIRAVVDYYGPSNLIDICAAGVLTPAVEQLLGHSPLDDPKAAYRASPLAYCYSAAPPFLLIHGDADQVVPISESDTLQSQLHTCGGSAEVIRVPGGAHASPSMHTPEIYERIISFLDANLSEGSENSAS